MRDPQEILEEAWHDVLRNVFAQAFTGFTDKTTSEADTLEHLRRGLKGSREGKEKIKTVINEIYRLDGRSIIK